MHKMISQSHMSYGTRRLRPGDEFVVVSPRHAVALSAIGRAREVKEPPPVPSHDEITMLRAEYQRRFGKRPYMGWDEAQLREKIAAAA
jgi:hypothetical protein